MELENAFSAILLQIPDFYERLNPFICPFPSRIGPCCCPCERENTFSLLYADENFQQPGQLILNIKEKSNSIIRCLCCPSARGMSLEGSNFYNEQCITAEKPLQLAFCNPELQVYYKQTYIGKIKDPLSFQNCRFLFHEIHVCDRNGAINYIVKAKLMQCGICCFLPIQPCNEILYNIYNKKNEVIGQIKHLYQDGKKEYCTKSDKFGIKFPKFATVEEKVLLVMTMVFINYVLFENL